MLIHYFRYVISDLLLESLRVCFLNQLIHISFCDSERLTYLLFSVLHAHFNYLFKYFHVFCSPGTVWLESTGCTIILG